MNPQDTFGEKHKLYFVRYNYICNEISRLNRENTQVFLTYVGITTPLVTSLSYAMASWSSGQISSHVMELIVFTLQFIILFSSLSVALIIGSNVLSWRSYRNDEYMLLHEIGLFFRDPPNFTNFYYWFEFWALSIIVSIAASSTIITWKIMLPMIAAGA